MYYVVDCSFSSALFLPDEQSDEVRSFFLKLQKTNKIFVPVLWWYETVNVLTVTVKRKRIFYANALTILDGLEQLQFITDDEYGLDSARKLLDLTQLYNISSYDAAYLELAARKKAKLLSLDKEMQTVAGKIGIDCWRFGS